MVSHKHKCIFVHIPKAAGTSIEVAFLEDLNLDMENRHSLLLGGNSNKSSGPRRISHLTATEYIDLHFVSEEIYNEYFKFAIVRNPIDRLYSTYKYKRFIDYISFDDFIKLKLEHFIKSETEGYFYKSQYDYLYKNGIKLVDFIGRLENLNSDFDIINQRLNLKLKLKHINESKKLAGINRKLRIIGKVFLDPESWTSLSFKNKNRFLSEKSLAKIERYYAKDFEVFNYTISNRYLKTNDKQSIKSI